MGTGGGGSPRNSHSNGSKRGGGVQIVLPIFCKWFERDFLDEVTAGGGGGGGGVMTTSLVGGSSSGGGGGGVYPHSFSHQSTLPGGSTATATLTPTTTRTSFSAAMSSHVKPMRPAVRAMLDVLAQYCHEDQVGIVGK